MNNLRIGHLFETPELTPVVANWIYNQFWTDIEGVTAQSLAERFQESVNDQNVPLALIAFQDNEPVGTVSLIESDDDERTHLTPWLAALYVKPEFRSQGVGAYLVRELLEKARRLKIEKLYLGTERPDFYLRLGAKFHEQASPSFTILYFSL